MSFLKKVANFALIVHGIIKAVGAKEIKSRPSLGNYILHEDYSSDIMNIGFHNTIHTSFVINSNVPVTIQRYQDDRFMEGSQPVESNEATVLVTSDCSTTAYIPEIEWGAGSVDIDVKGASRSNEGEMSFLESSSYNVMWSYRNDWCEMEKRESGGIDEKSHLTKGHVGKEIERKDEQIEETPEQCDEETADVSVSNDCNINVEILLDGCSHSLHIKAPAIRVLEQPTLENVKSEKNSENDCVTDYEADIVFSRISEQIEGERSLLLPELECMRAMPGRPFVDSTGRTLHASPSIIVPIVLGGAEKVSSAEYDNDTHIVQSCPSPQQLDNNSAANQYQLSLGEEWTKNALGEHASVASFAAFSIALMTNHAPSDLVEGALNAALDEVRHAQISFDIASKLTGARVQPGPLPQSEHVFDDNLTLLALAVAREGCVDETLSALEAAAEVDLINNWLANNGDDNDVTKYDTINREMLVWIRDELRIIALEESNHAALAWRTIKWVCGVDSDACSAVKRAVLNEDGLDRAFQQRRFASFGRGSETLDFLNESWKKIHSHNDFGTQVTCDNFDYGDDTIHDQSFVSIMERNISRGIFCVK